MDENFVCECGYDNFWFFWDKIRCPKCYNEYKSISSKKSIFDYLKRNVKKEYLIRRFNNETKVFSDWEISLKTYKNKK